MVARGIPDGRLEPRFASARPGGFNRYLCSEIASEENPAGSQWYRYCNPEVDALLNQQAATFDPEERQRLIFQIQEILHDDAYWIWLYSAATIYTAPAALNNFVLHPFANFYWNPQVDVGMTGPRRSEPRSRRA